MSVRTTIKKNAPEIIARWKSMMEANEETDTASESALGGSIIKMTFLMADASEGIDFDPFTLEYNLFKRHSLCDVMYEMQLFRRSVIAIMAKNSLLTDDGRSKVHHGFDSLLRHLTDYYIHRRKNRTRALALESQHIKEIFSKYQGKFSNLFEETLGGVVISDSEANIIAANNYLLKILGYTADEIKSGSWTMDDITPSESRGIDREHLKLLIEKGNQDPFERPFIGKDQAITWVLMGYSFIDADKRDIIGFVLDITERKNSEQELRKNIEQLDNYNIRLQTSNNILTAGYNDLKELADSLTERNFLLANRNKELQNFSTIAAHDLKAPLASIIQATEAISNGTIPPEDPEFNDCLQYLSQGSQRMIRLVDSLLEYAKIDGAQDDFKQISLNQIINEVKENLRADLQSVNLTVRSLPDVVGTPIKLNQLFQNLISNSIKYSGKNNLQIDIHGEIEGSQVTVSIDDNGPGIPEDSWQRIFEPFVRGNSRADADGAGLGLAICQKIVDRHGGLIWIENSPLGGARISFTLKNWPSLL